MKKVTVYGAKWCDDTQAALAHLRERKVEFDFRDLDESETDAEEFRRLNSEAGIEERLFPTILVDGELLSGFDPRRLELALGMAGYEHII
jgi:glutaredoxin